MKTQLKKILKTSPPLRKKSVLLLTLFFGYFALFCKGEGNGEQNQNRSKMADSNQTNIIELPKPKLKGEVSLEECLNLRRSVRRYSREPMQIEELSQLLWAAYGVTKKMPGAPDFLRGGFRTAPSAGALYPLEIYAVATNVENLDDGAYYYESSRHVLIKAVDGNLQKTLVDATFQSYMMGDAAAVLVYSAIYERTTRKYGQRGRDRYVPMDVGHSAQNVYLQSVALGLGCCAVGAFKDDLIKKTLQMKDEEEPLYLIAIGKKVK